MSINEQSAIEDQVLQAIWNAQAQLKAATDLVDQHCATLEAGESFVLNAFSGFPILDACEAVEGLEHEVMDAKFEKVGEAAYFPRKAEAATT